jgi:hypothetical protein
MANEPTRMPYRREVATCALSPRGRHCEGHPQHGSPIHPGTWAVDWMKPEPMHSVEILDAQVASPDLRIEIKCRP